jgi:hypothetical protein
MWPCVVTNFFIIKPTRCRTRSCSKALLKPVWHIPVPSLHWINSWWWVEELPETCRVSYRSKFGKFVLLVGFIIKKKCPRYLFAVRWDRTFGNKLPTDAVQRPRKAYCWPSLPLHKWLCYTLMVTTYHVTHLFGQLQSICCWTAGEKPVFGRSCDRPPRYRFSWFPCVFQANAEMVPMLPSCHYMLLV